MPRYQATLLIELKKGILDPQGRAVEGVLKDLGHPVEEVRVGKVLEIVFPAENLLEAEEKASGRAQYIADMSRPGMLHAAIVQSPHANARIRGYDVIKRVSLPALSSKS